MIERRFVPLDHGQVHYRRAGSGPTLLLLHAAPLSGASLIPLLTRLAGRYTVIAPDLPGYGLSDGLGSCHARDPAAEAPALEDYVPALRQFLDRLGIARTMLYGTGSGAALARHLARRHPERVALCLLESRGDAFDDGAPVPPHAFPDLAPRRDGSHLLTGWDLARSMHLFSPWYRTDRASRIDADPPSPATIQATMLELMRAGPGYARLARAAAATPSTSALPGAPAAPTIQLAGHDLDALLATHSGVAAECHAPAATPAADAVDATAARLQKCYVAIDGGLLFARLCLAGSGRPLLGLHDPAGSSRRLEGVFAPYLGRRPVIALDLPGSGESDPLLDDAAISIERYAQMVARALDALGVSECDVVGRYSGGQVAMELSLLRPRLVEHIVQYGVMIFEEAERADALLHYTPSVAPHWDGRHLPTAWAAMRDMLMFWPWYRRTAASRVARDVVPDAVGIDARVQDLLKIGDRWQRAYAASFRYPMHERLRATRVPLLLADFAGSASHSRLAAAQAADPRCAVADLPEEPAAWPALFDRFFASGA